MELLATGDRVGYLLKSRVTGVDDFVETSDASPAAARSWIPASYRNIRARRRNDPLETLTPREQEVLSLMAKAGRTRA